MSETIKVELDDELVRKFKKKALESYGYKKGAIKWALEELLKKYTNNSEADWDQMIGVLSDRNESSVELQHKAWNSIKHKNQRLIE